MLIDLDDNAVFDIFARLNTYSVKLNNQELLNSQFFGLYKQLVYRLAQEYRTFWIDSGILSEKNISRMEDAKLVSELLSVIVTGSISSNSFDQSKKLYAKYDDSFDESANIECNFKYALDIFCKIYPTDFSATAFAKVPLFYSTFLALYHMNHPIAVLGDKHHPIDESSIPKLRTVLDEIDRVASSAIDDLSSGDEAFVITLKKNTTTPDVRIRRCKYIVNKLMEAFD